MEFKRKGYYLRLLPAQCTLWDNVLIGRDPQTAEVMLSLLRKAEGGDWRWVAGFAPTDLKKKKKSFCYTCLNPHGLQKIRELVIATKKVHIAVFTLLITRETQEKKTFSFVGSHR